MIWVRSGRLPIMSDPEELLYCQACGSCVDVERIPMSSGAGTQWINGGIRCPTPGCPFDQGVVDRHGNPVEV